MCEARSHNVEYIFVTQTALVTLVIQVTLVARRLETSCARRAPTMSKILGLLRLPWLLWSFRLLWLHVDLRHHVRGALPQCRKYLGYSGCPGYSGHSGYSGCTSI